MRKLLAAVAFLAVLAVVYQRSMGRLRSQLMGAAHPVGAMSAVRPPKRRGLLPRRRDPRFDVEDVRSGRDVTWVDGRQFTDAPMPARSGEPARAWTTND